MKVLLDTDIGSDIDDAVCLAYLLAQPACELLGVTTVTSEATARAAMVSAMCRVAGRDDVPIYPGVERPLLVAPRQTTCAQRVALPHWPHRTDFPQHAAVSFLAETIRANPGEVTLLAIGPLTNVALLFALHPDVPPMLKELCVMAGYFSKAGAEWNVKCDPHAAAMVYNAPVGARPPRFRSIGLDVTLQVTMPAPDVRQRFQTPLLRPVLSFAEVWFGHAKEITFHDPLAAACLFDDAICQFTSGTVTVQTDVVAANSPVADPTAPAVIPGTSFWQADAAGPHEVATTVDAARFFQHYFARFA